jgi:hypothetical protein
MRRGIVTTLSATAVTGAVMAMTGFAAPAYARATPPGKAHAGRSLPVTATDSFAGYEDSGRDFRFINAVISVPNQPQPPPVSRPGGHPSADVPEDFLYPQAYVQLSSGSLGSGDVYARTGVETCLVAEDLDPGFICPDGVLWVAFIETFINSTEPEFSHFVPLDANSGDGIGFSIYYPSQYGTAVYFTLTAPSCATGGLGAARRPHFAVPGESGNQCVLQFQAPVPGPVFDHAAGLADYTNNGGTPIPLPSGTPQFRITQFRQGAVTTNAGNKGSWTGPWVTSQIEATSNGLPFPEGTVEGSPSFLWTDGAVANGAARNSDAFGVWERA